jgi:hypothetical protein
MIRLELGAEVSVSELETIFGVMAKTPRLHFDEPRQLVADIEPSGFPCGFRIVAELKPGPDAVQYRGPVAVLTIMRQPRASDVSGGA